MYLGMPKDSDLCADSKSLGAIPRWNGMIKFD